MRSRVLRAATFFLSLQLLGAASAQAQSPQPPTPPKARPPDASIAHNVITWLHHITGTGGQRHRIASSPPLPRPRPAQLTKTPAELPAAAVEQNKAPAVEPNEVQPAAAAVEPNKMSQARDMTFERDRLPTAEPKDVQPVASAAEPNKISSAPAPAVEPDKAPAEIPAAAVKQNEAPPRASAGALLRGQDIPD